MFTNLKLLTARLRAFFQTRKLDGEFDREFDSHLEMLVEDNVRRGLPPDLARREALVRLGGRASLREQHRNVRGLPILDTTLNDLRYAFRMVRRNPGFATVAVLSLAIGIGANTAIFSIVNAVLLQPLAYESPDHLFAVRELNPQFAALGPLPVNPVHAQEWAAQCASVAGSAVMRAVRAQISSGGEPASISAALVPQHLFPLLGVKPIVGRTFHIEEEQEGNDGVVVLSESLWRSRFNADPSIAGKSILLDGENHAVVGVVPASFRLPYSSGFQQFAIYRPLVLSPEELSRRMGNFNYAAVIRLKPGASEEQALAEINVVQDRFREGLKATLIPVHELVTGRARLGLWMLAAAVGAVLLIVCVNLANLLLSRVASRSREAAIRSALGASRGRQCRQLLTESLILAIPGGIAGILFAGWIVQLLLAATTLDIPRLDEVRIDSGVLSFALALTVLTGVVFGSLPAWRFTRQHPHDALRAGSHTLTEGRRGLRVRELLISLEVGLSAALLIVAALLGTSLNGLLEVDKGFDVDDVLTIDVALAGSRYAEPVQREQLFERLLSKVRALPGVQASGMITHLPTRGQTFQDPIYLQGDSNRPLERHPVNNRYASPEYFRALGIAVRQGRAFDERDRGVHVAVLSEKAARLLWPSEPNPVGRHFIGEDDKPKTLVGIVADVRASLLDEAPPMAYYPFWQRVPDAMALVVRTSTDSPGIAGQVRNALRNEDAQLPIAAIRTMDEVVNGSLSERRFQLSLMVVFAASSLLVASLGIYGVISYSVARRRNEIGIRMALGAQRSTLLALVIRQGLRPVVIGLAVGVPAALWIAESIRGLLFEVEPTDPRVVGGVSLVLILVGALACLVPARRAASTDVVSAIRTE